MGVWSNVRFSADFGMILMMSELTGSLSPDGQRVAFHLASPQGYQIWISDVHGQQRQLIAADPNYLYFGTSWSQMESGFYSSTAS